MRAQVVGALVAGVVTGGLAVWAWTTARDGIVEVREGTGFASTDYDSIVVEGEDLSITPEWKHEGVWNDAWPPKCVPNVSNPEPARPLRVGVVDVEPSGEAPGTTLVAWLDCDESGLD